MDFRQEAPADFQNLKIAKFCCAFLNGLGIEQEIAVNHDETSENHAQIDVLDGDALSDQQFLETVKYGLLAYDRAITAYEDTGNCQNMGKKFLFVTAANHGCNLIEYNNVHQRILESKK